MTDLLWPPTCQVWGIAPGLQRLITTLSAAFLASAMAALGLDTDL